MRIRIEVEVDEHRSSVELEADRTSSVRSLLDIASAAVIEAVSGNEMAFMSSDEVKSLGDEVTQRFADGGIIEPPQGRHV